MSYRSVYGLTDEEAAVLESDDEEFYSDADNHSTRPQTDDVSDFSDGEEVKERGIFDDTELESRVLIKGSWRSWSWWAKYVY